ncbi:MAG: response regulator transcription factor [Sedimentisphaerales bacterium]|nr:response regulator transcription factor [Sedimentisphaerales bacterium]
MAQKKRHPKTCDNKKSIFIVDDHPIVRSGLITLIDHEKDLAVCGEAEDAPEALKAISELDPDVVILDIVLKSSDGIELTKDIKARHPGLPVIVLSMQDESVYAERALRAGARGYLMKEVLSEKIIHVIRMVLAGKVYVSSAMTQRLLCKMANGKGVTIISPTDSLSDRELEVFRMIGHGFRVSKIAERMHISVKTVETYRARIKEKLKLVNGDNLLEYAIKSADATSDA